MDGGKPVTIVGGGLAGLVLGIGLRQQSVPVTIWEAGQYPRHRVCGESINGRGQNALARLGLQERLRSAGASPGRTSAFFCGQASSPIRVLPEPALCVSRFQLDAELAAHFRLLGGDLVAGRRWTGEQFQEGLIWAGGRPGRHPAKSRAWFGLKTHATGVNLQADLEMYAIPEGYVGLCRLSDECINVCGLFRHRPPNRSVSWQDRLRGPVGGLLHRRLREACFLEETFCSVAGISLIPRRARGRPECCIGDALTMIPPVTGNGMSIAIESAELAIAPLIKYSAGTISWIAAHQAIANACDWQFGRRLAWARWLQRLMAAGPLLPESWVGLLLHWEGLWRTMFARTR